MISSTHKFIFVHIDKTGGSAITKSLADYAVDDVKIEKDKGGVNPENQIHVTVDGVNTKHWRYCDYEKWIQNIQEYFVFASIRNAWDRVLSGYLFFSSNAPLADKPKLIREDKNFAKWLRGEEYISLRTGEPKKPSPMTPQISFLINSQGQTPKNTALLDFYNLESGFNAVCEKLNLKPKPFEKVNVVRNAKKFPYWEYYNDKTKALVEQKFAADIKTFNQKFGELKAWS